MDLFGRKAAASLAQAEAMLAEQGDALKGAIALLAERDKQIENWRLAYELKIQDLARETLRTSELTQELSRYRPRATMSAQPLYMTEGEEDLKYQLDHNLIDVQTYQQLLKELEFENAEVSFAVEDLPESFHY